MSQQAGTGTSTQTPTAAGARGRLPVVFLPHGGGPWPFVDIGLPRAEVEELAAYLRGLRSVITANRDGTTKPPRALLVISAHWEAEVPTVMTSPRPPLYYDYYGFPKASYEITWPAPGQPELAARVRELLGTAGITSSEDSHRGFDHGTFIPLKLTWPEAEIPTVQLSLKAGLDPEEHLRIGRALAPLRDEGVLIIGSGMSFHNLRAFRDPRAPAASAEFDAWLRETAGLDQGPRDQRLALWTRAPAARFSHPREEHLLPLMVIAGAAGADRGTVAYRGSMFGTHISAFHFG